MGRLQSFGFRKGYAMGLAYLVCVMHTKGGEEGAKVRESYITSLMPLGCSKI